MEPGRELDALIAEKIMGWKQLGHDVARNEYLYEHFIDHVRIVESPRFSTRISAAWQVVEEMKLRGWSFGYWESVGWSSVCRGPTAAFRLSVFPPEMDFRPTFTTERQVSAVGETMAHAVCLAALKAMEG